jgi:hypothetical protein
MGYFLRLLRSPGTLPDHHFCIVNDEYRRSPLIAASELCWALILGASSFAGTEIQAAVKQFCGRLSHRLRLHALAVQRTIAMLANSTRKADCLASAVSWQRLQRHFMMGTSFSLKPRSLV